VDGVALTASTNFDSLLEHKSGKQVDLALSGGRKATLRAAGLTELKRLRYRAWVEEKRALVNRFSGGKLGYVHIPDMSAESLARLYLDLDAENHSKEGVVIDVRNNNGGFINAYALDVFARRGYLTFQERGRAPVPARSVLGQRSLELPTILITNQHSLSDAEDFSEGYRRLRIGKVVGEPTAGWIVYTSNQELVDGSTLRLPRTKVFDNDGQLMEMHPRPVDIPVQRPLGETYTGHDLQLETAVRELLQQVENGRGRAPSSTSLQ
jgi:C-terminal processing protease CtpA/Prc